MNEKKLNRWINTTVQILILIVAIFALINTQTIKKKVNTLIIGEAEIDNLTTNQTQMICLEGEHVMSTWENNSFTQKCVPKE